MMFDAKQFIRDYQKRFNIVIKSARYLSDRFLHYDGLPRIRALNIVNSYSDPLLLTLFIEFKASLFCSTHVAICLALGVGLDLDEAGLQDLAFQAFVTHAFHEPHDQTSYNEQGICQWLNTCYSQLAAQRHDNHHPRDDSIHFVYQEDYEVHNRHRLTHYRLVPEGADPASQNSCCVIL